MPPGHPQSGRHCTLLICIVHLKWNKRALLVVSAPKCPTKYVDGDDEVEDFAASLKAHLSSKKGLPKKWWSIEVIIRASLGIYKSFQCWEARLEFP